MQCIVGQGSGQVLHLGRVIDVRIASVNLTGRHLDLVPAKPVAEKPRKKSKPQKKRPAKRKRR
jgi:hypothetical protein